MNIHLHREIEKLKNRLLAYSADVENVLRRSVKAFKTCDLELAGSVIENDRLLDQTEVEIEEDCLKILALHTPVANDLRFVVAVLKINNDLERIGDQAANIASRARSLHTCRTRQIPSELNIMADRAQRMLRESLKALIEPDVETARLVIESDDEVDDLNRKMFRIMQTDMAENPGNIECDINLLTVSRNLERVADLVTNIAEDVIYMVEGDIVRHKNKN